MQFPCGICKKTVAGNQKAVCCNDAINGTKLKLKRAHALLYKIRNFVSFIML